MNTFLQLTKHSKKNGVNKCNLFINNEINGYKWTGVIKIKNISQLYLKCSDNNLDIIKFKIKKNDPHKFHILKAFNPVIKSNFNINKEFTEIPDLEIKWDEIGVCISNNTNLYFEYTKLLHNRKSEIEIETSKKYINKIENYWLPIFWEKTNYIYPKIFKKESYINFDNMIKSNINGKFKWYFVS